MKRRIQATAVGIVIFASAVALAAIALKHSEPKTFIGAVLSASPDARKQLPISNAHVTVTDGSVEDSVTSDSAGFFRVTLQHKVLPGKTLALRFRHPDYEPLDLPEAPGDRLYIARMTPVIRGPPPPGKTTLVSSARVRYAMRAPSSINIGSAVKSFEVVNTGDLPCDPAGPCSPDNKWKASVAGISTDAGAGNQFRNVRVSCIAGACPFSRVENDKFVNNDGKIYVSVRAWSDTVTYLLEAEVWHTVVGDEIRQGYPAIFGSEMNFTLPAAADGPSIEANVDGMDIVFPLGPTLMLSWAECSASETGDGAKLYRCSLRPGYQFQ